MCHLLNGCRDVGAHINAAEDLVLVGCVAVNGHFVLVALFAQVDEGTVVLQISRNKT
jgi:hypothetical protein